MLELALRDYTLLVDAPLHEVHEILKAVALTILHDVHSLDILFRFGLVRLSFTLHNLCHVRALPVVLG